VALTLACCGVVMSSAAAPAAASVEWQEVCRFDDERLIEISGMARSLRHPNVIWMHNDSGDDAVLYGIDDRTCDTVAELRLRGVQARDFEGLASSVDGKGRSFLWVGDIGDNRDSWPNVAIYRVREPAKLGPRSRSAKQWRFTYPDRPHNAETLMVGAPASGRVNDSPVWAATWQLASGGMYSVPLREGVAIADSVGDVGSLITDGAIHPTGVGYVLRDYLDVHIFQGMPPGQRVAKLALPAQVQGEAITWTADGRGVFIASEKDPRLIRVDLPWWVLASLRPPDHLVAR
jgi:hypothetical protein